NLTGNSNFWDLGHRQHGSWIWKAICKLRSLARPFIVCEIGSGRTANFWRDSWAPVGPLIEILGPDGPRITGLPLHATVADGVRNGDWWKIGDQATVYKFNTANTWSYLFPPGPEVTWHKQIWFTSHIPKHAFFTWVNVRHRLATRDRMRRWGLDVPASCVLCLPMKNLGSICSSTACIAPLYGTIFLLERTSRPLIPLTRS
ncbi:unnamed protein product, partial [Brassica oleracea var. botrytis]